MGIVVRLMDESAAFRTRLRPCRFFGNQSSRRAPTLLRPPTFSNIKNIAISAVSVGEGILVQYLQWIVKNH